MITLLGWYLVRNLAKLLHILQRSLVDYRSLTRLYLFLNQVFTHTHTVGYTHDRFLQSIWSCDGNY